MDDFVDGSSTASTSTAGSSARGSRRTRRRSSLTRRWRMKSEAALPVHLRYACVFVPTAAEGTADVVLQLARDFSSRFEMVTPASVVIHVGGLERLLGDARAIGQELRRAAAERHLTAHVALAAAWSAALILARARPGLTIAPAGEEAARLAPLPIEVLASLTRG